MSEEDRRRFREVGGYGKLADNMNHLRQLVPSPAEVDRNIREALARAKAAGGSSGVLSVALLEVLSVIHEWNLRAMADGESTVTCREATDMIVAALERGLREA